MDVILAKFRTINLMVLEGSLENTMGMFLRANSKMVFWMDGVVLLHVVVHLRLGGSKNQS